MIGFAGHRLHRIERGHTAHALQSSATALTTEIAASSVPEPLLDTHPLRLKADWHYEQHGVRQHYTIQALLGRAIIGRAHGWFEPGGRFLLEKVELDARQRSKGYGTVLIEALRDKARESGCTEFVFHGVRAANDGAIRLYESMGARGLPTSDTLLDFVITPP